MRVPVAYWNNGLGELCDSRIFAQFIGDDGTLYLVVFAPRVREHIVIEASEAEITFEEMFIPSER